MIDKSLEIYKNSRLTLVAFGAADLSVLRRKAGKLAGVFDWRYSQESHLNLFWPHAFVLYAEDRSVRLESQLRKKEDSAMPFPANLTPLEIVNLGIRFEDLMWVAYDQLGRRTDFASLQAKLALLKKDEKDHRKTLKAHRRALFGDTESAATEEEARRIFKLVDVSAVHDADSLLRALQGAVAAEEYGAYFYDRMKDRIPDREVRIFFEVLVSEGRFHCTILGDLIALIRSASARVIVRTPTVVV